MSSVAEIINKCSISHDHKKKQLRPAYFATRQLSAGGLLKFSFRRLRLLLQGPFYVSRDLSESSAAVSFRDHSLASMLI